MLLTTSTHEPTLSTPPLSTRPQGMTPILPASFVALFVALFVARKGAQSSALAERDPSWGSGSLPFFR